MVSRTHHVQLSYNIRLITRQEYSKMKFILREICMHEQQGLPWFQMEYTKVQRTNTMVYERMKQLKFHC